MSVELKINQENLKKVRKLDSLDALRSEITSHPHRWMIKNALIPGYSIIQGLTLPKGEGEYLDSIRKKALIYFSLVEAAKLAFYSALAYRTIEHFAR